MPCDAHPEEIYQQLTAQQVSHYRDEGYILVEDLVPPDAIKELRSEIERLLELAATRTEHDDMFDFEESHSVSQPRVRRIKEPWRHSDVFLRLLSHPKLLSACRQLLGTKDLRRGAMKINLKAPGYGSPVQWHQDWAFYPHTNDSILAMGICLDDVVEDNGPLLAMPGTHRGPIYSHHQQASNVFVGGLDPIEAGLDFVCGSRMLCGDAGSVSFHHVRLVHGSALNHSGQPRRIVFLEVAAADAWPLAGVSNYESFEDFYGARMLCGSPTLQPRMEVLSLRVPLPKPEAEHNQGSIYASQQLMDRPFFDTVADKNEEPFAKL